MMAVQPNGLAEDSFFQPLVQLVETHIGLTEPIVFLLGFGESIAIVSLFIPSTALFLGIGGLHAAAGGVFWPVWLAGATGAFLGDLVSFAVGRAYREEVRRIWPLRSNPEWYVATRVFVRRRGVTGLVISKFLGAIRPFVPIVAGATGMRWPAFLIASPLSSLIWAGVFLGPGYGIKFLFE